MKKDLPFKHSHFGMNDCECPFHLIPFKETVAIWEHSFKLTSGMGMHWDRVHLPGVFSWNVVEHEKGRYDWKYLDALVKLAQKYEIHLLPNVWPFAWWDQEAWKGKGFPLVELQHMEGEDYLCDKTYPFPPRYASPHDWKAYTNWITAMVERYDGDGVDDMPGLKYPIKYWEIENEVAAMAWGLPPFPTKPENYSKLLKESYIAAKKADPECKIIIEGWTFRVNEPFLRHAIELGEKEGQQYFEIMNMHTYSIEETINDVLRTKDLLDEYGLERPIWITEWTPSGIQEVAFELPEPPGPGNLLPYSKEGLEDLRINPVRLRRERKPREPFSYSGRVGAKKVVIGLTVAFWFGVEKIFWATFGQRIKAPGIDSLNPLPPLKNVFGYTIMNLDGSLKLMYYTIGLFMEKLDTFKEIRKLDLGYNVNAYSYDLGPEWNPSLRQTLILWSDEKKELTLKGLPTAEVLVTNLIPETDEQEKPIIEEGKPVFKREIKKVVEGTVNITVTEDPIIIEIGI